ncbi:MAG: hypothetical protein VB080_11735 [Propionicimonas sp.]|uniref:hypothetical protein n=1 Tax=Propionicimonas sp. TaxID=1955623 RepID=UPI002B20987A|nr:hypothetical protein [Propionicimonas sp.]MEA4945093.1 hypothetical protein [Propionicimonas sp.]
MPNHGLAVRMHRAVVRRGRSAQAQPEVVVRRRAVASHARRALSLNRVQPHPAGRDRLFEPGRPRVWRRRGLVGPGAQPASGTSSSLVVPPLVQGPLFQPAEALEKAGALARATWSTLAGKVQEAEIPEKVGSFARSARSVLADQSHALAARVAAARAARAARPPRPAAPAPGALPSGARPSGGVPGPAVPVAGSLGSAVPVGAPASAGGVVLRSAPAPVAVPVTALFAPGAPALVRPSASPVQGRTGTVSPRTDGLGCVHTGVIRPQPVSARVPPIVGWLHLGALAAVVVWSCWLAWWFVAPAVTTMLTSQALFPDPPPIGDGQVVTNVVVWLVLLVIWGVSADWHDSWSRQAARDWLAAQCPECRYRGLSGRDLDAFIHPSRTLGIASVLLACLGAGLVGLGLWRALVGPESWPGETELLICTAIIAFVLAGGAMRTSSHQCDVRYRELLDLRLGENA